MGKEGEGALALLGANPVSAALGIGGAILGVIGMKKRRKEARRRRRREKRHALTAQNQLISSVKDIRSEYRERAQFGRKAFELGQQRGLLNFGQQSDEMNQSIGQTGLAYSGTLQGQKSMMEKSFDQENKDRSQGFQEQRFGLEKQLEGDLRGVQTGLLNLEATAMERGYSLGPKTKANINTQAKLGGY
jgi:hypothetical protein